MNVSNDELRTVREAMRELNRMIDALDRGDVQKFVLMRGREMVAVITPIGESFESEIAQVGGAA